MTQEMATDVAVVGAGPCGITLANLLALWGVRATVLEAQPDLYSWPRAVGIDDESLRTYQTIGIVDRLLEDIIQNTPIRYYTSWGRLMAHVEPSIRPFGWPRRNNFLQPLFESALRERVAASESVKLWLGARLTGYEQDPGGVTADVETGDTTAGIVCALGDWSNGWACYLLDGRLVATFNVFGTAHRFEAERATPPGRRALGIEYRREQPVGGPVTLTVDGEVVAEGGLPVNLPFRWQIGGAGLLIGRDRGFPVCDDYEPPFPFIGILHEVVLEIPSLEPRVPPDEVATALRHE